MLVIINARGGLMYKLVRECGMPKWLKILINITLTVTCVYWLGYFLYKILDVFRLFFHTMTEPKVFWIGLGILLGSAIITLLILEYNTDIKPFTMMWEWVLRTFDGARDKIAEIISSK